MTRRIAAVALAISLSCLGFMTMLAGPAWGCSCAGPDPSVETEEIVRGALYSSEAVFAGEVIAIEKPPEPPVGSIVSDGEPMPVTFRVFEVWKGSAEETLEIITADGGCGYDFVEESSYLVYTSEGQQVGLCSSTKLLSEAEADLKVLGDGTAPAESDLPETSGALSGAALISSFLPITVGAAIRRTKTNRK